MINTCPVEYPCQNTGKENLWCPEYSGVVVRSRFLDKKMSTNINPTLTPNSMGYKSERVR